LGAIIQETPSAASETENYATGEVQILGTLNRGSYTSTHAADGNYEKIAEARDSTGNQRLEWQWTFNVTAGSSYVLHVMAQATSTKQGMDHYEFSVRQGDSDWATLGQVTQTTMTAYTWPFPAGDFSGSVTIKAVDTNQASDPRRANQLWIDHLYVLSSGAAPEPLGAPSDLSAAAVSASAVDLAWRDNATAETRFEIERKEGAGGSYVQIAQVAADTEAYQDAGLLAGTTYFYRVRAHDGAIASPYSNEASATPQEDGGGGGSGSATGPQTDKIIAGYFPSWGIYNARKYWVRYIPFDRITHVYYAFANIDPTSLEVVIGDSFAELTNTKDPETDYGLPAGNLYQLTHFRDFGYNGPSYKHLKIIISVGGWTWSENFSDAALTAESRWRFAESLKTFVETYDLDGADLNWEFPTGDSANCGEEDNVCRPEDPINFALLIMACRAKLGPDKVLSIAAPAGAHSISQMMPPLVDNNLLADASEFPLVFMRNPDDFLDAEYVAFGDLTAIERLDYVHIMNYDHVGASWEDTTRHHAHLYGYEGAWGDPAEGDPIKETLTQANGHFAVQAYRHIHDDYSFFDPDDPSIALNEIGEIPASKLTLGVPMYGRGFKSVDPGDWDGFEGLFQFTDGSVRRRTPKGTWDGGQWGNSGVFAYWDLLLRHGGDVEAVDHNVWEVGPPITARPYGAYTLEGDLFVGFDNLTSIVDKMDYVENENLAGVMFWDFPGDVSEAQIQAGVPGADDAYPAKSLIHHIANRLEALQANP
jgi:chitinase